jgi:hypothetical protein
MAERRSIVQFEKWVDGEIQRVTDDLNGLEREVSEVRRRRALEEVRLETLHMVKQRLAVPEEIRTVVPVAGEDPDNLLTFSEAHDPDVEAAS